ncbi:MAG TPA: hypothetical protein ENJ56_02605, partial [Anaerolineae bacterium]|nr:hypothetical protein [Anaerolineae bacterium]
NQKRAFYNEASNAQAREAEEIRRKRRAARRAQHAQPDNNPPRITTRQQREPQPLPLPAQSPTRVQLPPADQRVVIPARDPQKKRKRRSGSCFLRWLVISFLLLLFLVVATAATLTIGYVVIASDLPSVREIETKTSSFETVFIYDADGNELYSVTDPTTGNRTRVAFDQIDPDLINATIATEDSRFYTNFGFDPIAIGRAVSEVLLSGAFTRGDIAAAGGASTITQQLVRATLLSEDERGQQTVKRKIREIILSAELNRTLTRDYGEKEGRDKILELYLNEIYYGNRAYGIEAAAQTYFKKSAADLTLAEAALLAGLPQAPALWDPITAPEFAEGRQKEVLELMVAHGDVSKADAQAALNERLAYTIEPPISNIVHPHFTLGVLAELEATYGADTLYNSGFKVYTTLRPDIQQLAEDVIAEQRGNIEAAGANNAALVVIDPRSAEILALVGSLDYRDEAISGQVNMVRSPRQPGSTIKPFVYLAGMERGMTPATLFWDVPSQFPDGTNPPYQPKNYDNEFHGPMLLRTALANSYNIPAVKALEFVGVCNFISRAQAWGLGLHDEGCAEQGQPRNVGLALSLGGGEISPLQMASAYAMLANGGQPVQPVSIRSIINKDNAEIYAKPAQTDTDTVDISINGVSPDLAFLLDNILSDNNARIPEFGQNNLLHFAGRTVAAKTGTSGTDVFDVRDAWTIGFTPQFVTAIWVGNTDNQPLGEGASGYQIAAPIWNSFMSRLLDGREDLPFVPPSTVTTFEICADSGVQPNPNCEARKIEYFSREHLPLASDKHFLRSIDVDRWTLRIANQFCNDEDVIRVENFDLLVSGFDPTIQARYRAEVAKWLEGNGRWWADRYGLRLPLSQSNLLTNQACEAGTQRPIVQIEQPFQGETVQGFVQIGGQATAPGFAGYELQYGYGDNPSEWFRIGEYQTTPQPGGLLGILNTAELTQGGTITVRLIVYGADNPYTPNFVDRARKEDHVQLVVPQPTPVPTATPSATPQPTAEPTSTPTPASILPPTATPETDIPTATPTPVAVDTATPSA